MSEERDGRTKTAVGHGPPAHDLPRSAPAPSGPPPEPSGPVEPVRATPTALAPMTHGHDDRPLIEVEVVHQHGPAPRMETTPEALEIWTMNRVYVCDARGVCIAVRQRRGGPATSKDSPVVGARLIGGQLREGERFGIAVPYPRPGMEAVFEHERGAKTPFSRTSPVERVVLRLQHYTVDPSRLVPTWSEITRRGF
ncbi:MAG: hypothetical protein AAF447_14905 [Myxococcota bacterium]